jgi:hypothetical protein
MDVIEVTRNIKRILIGKTLGKCPFEKEKEMKI